ncbi:MAG: hypothetical protein EOO41_01305, partial [Methanobacteriota archaeon]
MLPPEYSSATPTPSVTPSSSATPSNTASVRCAPSGTPSVTATPTASASGSVTATASMSASVSSLSTATLTSTPSTTVTPTSSSTSSMTPSASSSVTALPSAFASTVVSAEVLQLRAEVAQLQQSLNTCLSSAGSSAAPSPVSGSAAPAQSAAACSDNSATIASLNNALATCSDSLTSANSQVTQLTGRVTVLEHNVSALAAKASISAVAPNVTALQQSIVTCSAMAQSYASAHAECNARLSLVLSDVEVCSNHTASLTRSFSMCSSSLAECNAANSASQVTITRLRGAAAELNSTLLANNVQWTTTNASLAACRQQTASQQVQITNVYSLMHNYSTELAVCNSTCSAYRASATSDVLSAAALAADMVELHNNLSNCHASAAALAVAHASAYAECSLEVTDLRGRLGVCTTSQVVLEEQVSTCTNVSSAVASGAAQNISILELELNTARATNAALSTRLSEATAAVGTLNASLAEVRSQCGYLTALPSALTDMEVSWAANVASMQTCANSWSECVLTSEAAHAQVEEFNSTLSAVSNASATCYAYMGALLNVTAVPEGTAPTAWPWPGVVPPSALVGSGGGGGGCAVAPSPSHAAELGGAESMHATDDVSLPLPTVTMLALVGVAGLLLGCCCFACLAGAALCLRRRKRKQKEEDEKAAARALQKKHGRLILVGKGMPPANVDPEVSEMMTNPLSPAAVESGLSHYASAGAHRALATSRVQRGRAAGGAVGQTYAGKRQSMVMGAEQSVNPLAASAMPTHHADELSVLDVPARKVDDDGLAGRTPTVGASYDAMNPAARNTRGFGPTPISS